MREPPITTRRALLSWTISTLRRHGVKPRKKLSQSFLVEPLAIREIIGWLERRKPRTVVEIGAGLGTLTYHIARHVDRVIAIEIDPRLARIAWETAGKLGNVEVIVGDALETPLPGDTVVSSLPYHVAGPLIARILGENNVEAAALILQAELAEKLAAPPGSRSYGRLSALAQFLAYVERGHEYSPTCFYPVPRVASQTIYLYRRRPYDALAQVYEEMLRCLFTQRNKRALKVILRCTGIEASWIPVEARVRDLDPGQLESLAHALSRRRRG